MKILVGCHCKEPFEDYDEYLDTTDLWSPKLNFINQTGEEINTDKIEYYFMDKREISNCPSYGQPNQYDNWDDIPNDYFDLVWLEHCPITEFTSVDGLNRIDEIIGNSIKKLKYGGILITEMMKKYQSLMNSKIPKILKNRDIHINHVEKKYMLPNELPYILTSDNPDDIQNLIDYYLTIKKKTNEEIIQEKQQRKNKRGGTYKRKKSKKSKTRKMKTKKRYTRY